MVRPVAREIVERHMPGIENVIAFERDFLPTVEGADNLDRFRFRMAWWEPPAEDFREGLTTAGRPALLRRCLAQGIRGRIDGIALSGPVSTKKTTD